jgi:hypothetical protein
VRREATPRPPKPGQPQGEEARQPVQRGRTVTPKPETTKDKKDPKDKTDKREKKPD